MEISGDTYERLLKDMKQPTTEYLDEQKHDDNIAGTVVQI